MDPHATLGEQLEYYRSQHRTRGNILCHLVGIPLIGVSIAFLPFSRRRSLELFALAWAFQLAGHYVFEKNKPVLFSNARDPKTILAALIWVSDEWSRLLTGRPLVEDKMRQTEQPALLSIDGNGHA